MFMMRLAMALGMTLARLKDEMTTAEVRMWMAFNTIEPIGEMRSDVRNAMWCSLYANSVRGKNSRKFSLKDFLPFLAQPSEEQKKRNLADKVRSMFVTTHDG